MEQVLKPSCEMKSFHSLFFGTVFVCCFKYEVREAFFFFFQRKVMKGQVQPRAALVRQLPSFVVRERNGRCRHTVWHGESREMLIDSVSLRFPGFENQFSWFFFSKSIGLKHTFASFLSSPQLDIRKPKGCSHLLLFVPWMKEIGPILILYAVQSCSTWSFWVIFDYLGLSCSLLTVPNVLFPVFCPRHLWKALPAQLCGPGDVSLQDLHPSRAAQPCLQGNFHLPGCPLPALRCHTNDLHIQQTQHEAQRDDRLDLHGAEQQRRRRAKSLAGDEGVKGAAGLQVAHIAGVLMVTRAACRSWDHGLSSIVLSQQEAAVPCQALCSDRSCTL